MNPVILYRPKLLEEDEEQHILENFGGTTQRATVEPGSLVIGRYSVLPEYKELETDLKLLAGVRLINTYEQHRYDADLRNWVPDLRGLTPRTWERLVDLPDVGTAFVLKGETNSRKDQWSTHMYAANKTLAIRVASRLMDDSLIGSQQIWIREYVPLWTYLHGLGGIPVTEEYRFFVAYGEVLCGAFYWQNYEEEVREAGHRPDAAAVPEAFLDEVVKRVGDKINFYVVDVARTAAGGWMVVELNDGQMSGLSCVDPGVLYSRLREVVQQKLHPSPGERCICTFHGQAWINDYAQETFTEEFDATDAILAMGKEAALQLRDDQYESDALVPPSLLERNGENPYWIECREAIREFFDEDR